MNSPSGVDGGARDDAGGDAGEIHEAGGEEHADAGRPFDAFVVDVPNVVRRSNIVLGKPNTKPQESMPLGNGALGVAAWAAGGFTAQLNRSDTLPDRRAVAQVAIPALAKLTSATDFAGLVDLYDAMLVESGGGMTAKAFVRADAPELVVDVTGADPSAALTARIALWDGRAPTALAADGVAVLAETWKDASGLGASGETFGSLAAIAVDARGTQVSIVDPRTAQVSFQPKADGSFRIVIAAPAWTGGDAMAAAKGALGGDATASATTLRAGHLAWWHDYWSKVGLMKLTSADGTAEYLEALRTIYLYTSAAESRGAPPGSQAGVADLFNFLGDRQAWFPAGYWFWNMRMLVAANMSAGAFEMNAPIFALYQSNLAHIQDWTTTKMGGRAGICVPETMRFNGNGSYNGGEDNASCDEGIAPSYNTLTITTGAEIGQWIWQQYRMTDDRAFLTANYPVMREAARFLLAYATLGADGLLHTVANAHETQWKVKDPITDIAAMQALFPAVIAAAKELGTDAALASDLGAALAKLPALPRTDAATHMQLLTKGDDAGGNDVFALSYEPSAQKRNGENLDLEPVWPYGLIGDDGADSDLAKRTYQHRMFMHSPDWSCDALQAARLGLAGEVASALVDVTKKYQAFVSGMALLGGGTNDGSSEPYIEQSGIVAAALAEALVQDYDGVLRLAPAWPAGWDAAGTVYIQGGSRLHVQVTAGKAVAAFLEAGSAGPLVVRNPWTGQSVTVIDGFINLPVATKTAGVTVSFDTAPGHWYVIAPSDATGPLPHVDVTGSPADKPKALGPARIGL